MKDEVTISINIPREGGANLTSIYLLKAIEILAKQMRNENITPAGITITNLSEL